VNLGNRRWNLVQRVLTQRLFRSSAGQAVCPGHHDRHRIYFADHTLTGKSGGKPGGAAKSNSTKKCMSLSSDSLRHGPRKVGLLTDSLPNLPESHLGIGAVNHAPQKSQSLRSIVAVPPHVVLRNLDVQARKLSVLRSLAKT